MRHSVAIYGKLLVVIGLAGYAAANASEWRALGPALLGLMLLLITCGPFATVSERVAGIAGALLAVIALVGSVGALPDLSLAFAGLPIADPLLTLSRSLTTLVSLSLLLALMMLAVGAGNAAEK